MPGPYNTMIPAQPPTGPYNTQIPVQLQDDPVLALLAPPAQAPNGDAYANNPSADVYANNPSPNAYQKTPNLSPPPAPTNMRPSAFDKQPDINNASPTGQVRILGAKGGRYDGEDTRNVKYINDLKTKREKYQVEIGATMLRRKMVFDTKEIKQHFVQKNKDDVGSATLGNNQKGIAFPTPPEWNEEALLWVCAPIPRTTSR